MLNAEQQKLVTNNLKLARFVMKKRNVPKNLQADAYQTAVIGLIKAASTFDENQGKFSTYAYRNIEWELMNFIHKEYSSKYCCLDVDVRKGNYDKLGRSRIGLQFKTSGQEEDCEDRWLPYEAFGSAEHVLLDSECSEELRKVLVEAIQEVGAGDSIKTKRFVELADNLLSSEPKTLTELGKQWGVSKQRVAQLWNQLKRAVASSAPELADYLKNLD